MGPFLHWVSWLSSGKIKMSERKLSFRSLGKKRRCHQVCFNTGFSFLIPNSQIQENLNTVLQCELSSSIWYTQSVEWGERTCVYIPLGPRESSFSKLRGSFPGGGTLGQDSTLSSLSSLGTCSKPGMTRPGGDKDH